MGKQDREGNFFFLRVHADLEKKWGMMTSRRKKTEADIPLMRGWKLERLEREKKRERTLWGGVGAQEREGTNEEEKISFVWKT